MGTIFRIFIHDIGEIVRHFFVLVVVIGLIILPALYAWVNIYANWDPYVNTGNMPMAVVSRDPGFTKDDGTRVNAAEDIEEELRKNRKVDWQFPSSVDEAVEGVRSGKYYAAIIFEDKFTYNMYNLKDALVAKDPSIVCYTNNKKSVIGAKIADTAAANLQETINTKYLQAVFDQVFRGTNKLGDKLESRDSVDRALKELTETRDALHDFNMAIDTFSGSSEDIARSLRNAEDRLDQARSKGKKSADRAKDSIDEAKAAVKALSSSLDRKSSKLQASVSMLQDCTDELAAATDEEEARRLAQKAEKRAESVLTVLKDIRGLLPDSSRSSAVRVLVDRIDIMILDTEEILRLLQEDPMGNAKSLKEAVSGLKEAQDSDLSSDIEALKDDLRRAVQIARPLLSATGGLLDDIDPILESAGGTVNSLDGTLQRLKVVLNSLEDKLDDIISRVEEEEDDGERTRLLTKLLGGDPDAYSDFFSSLVRVDKHEVYTVGSYGAAMTPFYTILAIWVGGVVLAALFRTRVNRRKFPQATEAQRFFGRYLIFFFVAQLQAAVIVAGDIFLLHCDPEHPWLMWLVAAVTSMVFMIFIYAMVLSFGDIGKGLVVVIMVLQIAGSSGSYPIELLPDIFSKIYLFFPFPYAINAMREALCGTYEYDIFIYLGKLLIFGVVGIIIGLLVRRPFIGMNRFVNEKLEETEVL